MLDHLSRRKKGLVVTVIVGVFFVGIVVVALVFLRPKRAVYLPGSEVSGLTSALNRSIPDDAPFVAFRDVTSEAGINFRHFSGRRTSQIVEDMGSGAAWGDYDNDGWQDLFVANIVGPFSMTEQEITASAARAALYHNNRDGTFTDVSVTAGVALKAWGSAPAWGDYDGDGHLDLFVSSWGENVLFRNNADGTFSDVSDAAGLSGFEGFWAGASWSDYDRDGDLDIYVTGYVVYESDLSTPSSLQYDIESPASINPSSFRPERNLLFRNDGNGSFTEVAQAAGVSNLQGRSLSASWADFDDDGWPDLYVSNDISDNVLFRNFGDGTFDDVSHLALVADYRGAMGQAVGDWDGDGDLDLMVTHWLAQENALYNSMLNSPAAQANPGIRILRFQDVADRFGLGQIGLDFVGWGTSFFDYDNDSRLDLFIAHGSTLQQRGASHMMLGMRDILFWNGGADRGFFDVSGVSGAHFERELISRGAAFADYDNDGDVDIFVVNHGGPGVLLQNQGFPGNHWIELSLDGSGGNMSGIGARVRIEAGDLALIQEVGSQSSYMSQNSPVAHFGLGSVGRIDRIEVRWPSGKSTIMTDVEVDRILSVREEDIP